MAHTNRWRWRLGAAFLVLIGNAAFAADQKPRLIVLTDIGGDPDDTQSLVRLLVYANEFDIEGLIASASGTPGELKQADVKPHLIRNAIERYGEVHGNLMRHASGFPTQGELMKRVKAGNPNRGLKNIGDKHDTEGSRWIVSTVDKPDPRPVHIAIWGGQTDLAQALWRVRADRGPTGYREFITKIRIYDIADQDRIASWIGEQFPGLFYVLCKAPEGQDKRDAAFRGMYLGGDMTLTSRKWIDKHVRRNHGPLGELYPDRTWTAPNPHGALKEGDTPSWFYFLPNGLGHPQHPEWGCWGGRFVPAENGVFRDAPDRVHDQVHTRATVWRWRRAFQHEFQARMDWCVAESFDSANHPPVAVCRGDGSQNILQFDVAVEQEVMLEAGGSSDPDGDRLGYRWYSYPEAGTFRGNPIIGDADSSKARLTLPRGALGRTVHVILEVTDAGTPPLTAFRRIVLTGVNGSHSR